MTTTYRQKVFQYEVAFIVFFQRFPPELRKCDLGDQPAVF